MPEQVPYNTEDFGENLDFADNPEPRLPCVLLVDVSRSMAGQPIAQLNDGLVVYKDELAADSLASKRVEVAVVTFGGQVETVCPFATVNQFQPPALKVKGDTPMGAAILHACNLLEQRKQEYRRNGIAYYRPWLFLITDGGPTDEWRPAADAVRTGEQNRGFSFFAVGVEGANFDVLEQISTRAPLKLKGLRFRDLFLWLSHSQQSVSRSNPGDQVPLPNPATPDGWASV